MRELIDTYGELLIAIAVVITILATVWLVLPLIEDVLPGFVNSIVG